MKCISLWQIWAELVRRGLKLNETRSWPMPQGLIDKPLAIHAAKIRFDLEDYDNAAFRLQLLDDRAMDNPLIYGAVLCVVHPAQSIPTEKIRDRLSRRELLYGNYEDKRFVWPFQDIRVLPKPIPLIGRQGIFDWPEGDAIYREYLW